MKKGVRELCEEAEREIETRSVETALRHHGDENVVFVDIRDVRELWREGAIPGSQHSPRGMLEFWVDPESPYYKDVFAEGPRFVFYCQSGWRSALSTQAVQQMGLADVCHVGGGFRAWVDAGLPVEEVPRKK